MSLTLGDAPLSPDGTGRFNFELRLPDPTLYLEPSPRRIRVVHRGKTLAESDRARLLHRTGGTPVYCFDEEDVRKERLEKGELEEGSDGTGPRRLWRARDSSEESAAAGGPLGWSYLDPPGLPELEGMISFDWEAVDAWYEEAEEIHVHPRDPYHRIDVRQSDRRVQARLDGELVAESRGPRILFETGLPPRYYFPPGDVSGTHLLDSDHHTRCPYKGRASYYSVRTEDAVHEDVVWYYPDPLREAEKVAGMLAFYSERVDLIVDGRPFPQTVP